MRRRGAGDMSKRREGSYCLFSEMCMRGGFFFFWCTLWICLSRNGSTNINEDEIQYIYSDGLNILVSESL